VFMNECLSPVRVGAETMHECRSVRTKGASVVQGTGDGDSLVTNGDN